MHIVSIQAGRVAPLGPRGTPSAFIKTPVDGDVQVGPLGVVGDEHAEPRFHGGRDKAVYGYAAVHYTAWANEFPEHAFSPGAFGENLTIEGLNEDAICIGDVHAIGDVRLQVVDVREPCFKFALRFADGRMPKAMLRSGRSGWYYRVVQPGTLRTGDVLTLAERPHPDLPFRLLLDFAYHKRGDRDALARLASEPLVSSRFRNAARRKLARFQESLPLDG